MTQRCQIIQNGGCPSRTADKIRKSPTGCVIPEYQIGISPHLRVGTEHNGVQNRIGVFLLPRVPLCYALPGLVPVLSSSPVPGRGFPKGRAAARPFVSFQGGAGGNRNPPAFLFRGAGGDILFSKENIPLASPYRAGTFHREFPLWEQETHTGSPYSAQVLLSVTFTSIKLPIRLLSPFSRTSRLPSVREARGKFSSSLSPSTSTRTVLPT